MKNLYKITNKSGVTLCFQVAKNERDAIVAAREAASLTQTAAAELVHSALRTWQQWEAGDRKMHPGLWELFLLKIATANNLIKQIQEACAIACDDRYMGDNSREDMEAKNCAVAIRALNLSQMIGGSK